ncbi:hypothetical protein PUN28_020188 [Cardiocondyla obscurior]|uniref:Uncharacterized protein n=1 Tax=Cardiocondyla obscurior TaxID=286306 RepID=A0AAW2E8B2_9HYME
MYHRLLIASQYLATWLPPPYRPHLPPLHLPHPEGTSMTISQLCRQPWQNITSSMHEEVNSSYVRMAYISALQLEANLIHHEDHILLKIIVLLQIDANHIHRAYHFSRRMKVRSERLYRALLRISRGYMDNILGTGKRTDRQTDRQTY